MQRQLPSLGALRAFEAAARTGSMSLGALELNLTQGAVSKQIQVLEQFLRRDLFVRMVREIRLTEDGAKYFRHVSRILDELDNVTREVRSGRLSNQGVVRFSSYSGFNIHWLMPQLASFRAAHSQVDVRISSCTGEAIDLVRDSIDCAVRTGFGDWGDCDSDVIAPIRWRPVCTPEIWMTGRLREPKDLAKFTLLRTPGSHGAWRKWLEIVGEDADQLETSMMEFEFGEGALCYEAAVQGLGVTLADCMLVKRHVELGRLVYPFEQVYVDPRSYYFLYTRSLAKPALKTFRDWLITQMQADAQQQGEHRITAPARRRRGHGAKATSK